MNLHEYQEAAWRTANKSLDNRNQLINAALGIAGEAGEVAALFADGWQHRREDVIKELGDVCWYIACGCSALGLRLDSLIIAEPLSFSMSIQREGLLLCARAALVAEIVKKECYQGHPHDAHKISAALALVFQQVNVIAFTVGVSIGEILKANIDKLARRYPEKFEAALSVERVDI